MTRRHPRSWGQEHCSPVSRGSCRDACTVLLRVVLQEVSDGGPHRVGLAPRAEVAAGRIEG